MFNSRCSSRRLALASILLFNLVISVSAADIAYCSSLNTADTPKNSSIYQSNGLCSGFCNQNYAFAVVQFDGCWCSDYIPASETDGCDQVCPGYGFESCGGTGVFGYIELQRKASGTKDSSGSPSTTKQATTTVSTRRLTTSSTVTLPSDIVSTSETSSTSSSSTTNAPATTPDTSKRTTSTWTPTPVISLETVTGQVRTVTVTPTQAPGSQSSNQLPKSSSKGGLGVGGAVGLTIGLVSLVAIVCAIIYFCMKKKRQQKEEEYVDTSRESMQGLGGPIPSRSMSENSRYVLGTDGRQVVETWEPSENRDAPGSRKSRLMPVDPRLDPFSAVYQRNGENKSRESINTLRDDQDYSRRVHQNAPILRATNPD